MKKELVEQWLDSLTSHYKEGKRIHFLDDENEINFSREYSITQSDYIAIDRIEDIATILEVQIKIIPFSCADSSFKSELSFMYNGVKVLSLSEKSPEEFKDCEGKKNCHKIVLTR